MLKFVIGGVGAVLLTMGATGGLSLVADDAAVANTDVQQLTGAQGSSGVQGIDIVGQVDAPQAADLNVSSGSQT
jgi:hypothetical protein